MISSSKYQPAQSITTTETGKDVFRLSDTPVMTNRQLLSELLDIEAAASLLRERCCNIRKKLERINAPAPRKGKKAEIAEVIAKTLAKRERFYIRQLEKGKLEENK